MYKYIYYKLYKITKKSEKNLASHMRMPATLTIFSLSFLQFINLMTILILLVHWLKIFSPTTISKEIAIGTILFLYGINYFLFLRNRKFLLIEKTYDEAPKKLKSIKTKLFWIYIILSFALLFFSFAKFNTR